MLAMCLRKLQRFEEAQTLYVDNIRFYRYAQRKALVDSVFGLLLLPLSHDRRMIANKLEIIRNDMIAYAEVLDPVSRPLVGANTYWVKERGEWRS